MKPFQNYLYLILFLFIICCGKSESKKPPVYYGACGFYIDGKAGTNDLLVEYTISGVGTGDKLDSVTYSQLDTLNTINGRVLMMEDTTIRNPGKPWFWTSYVIPGAGYTYRVSGTSQGGTMFGRVTLKDSNEKITYMDSAFCR